MHKSKTRRLNTPVIAARCDSQTELKRLVCQSRLVLIVRAGKVKRVAAGSGRRTSAQPRCAQTITPRQSTSFHTRDFVHGVPARDNMSFWPSTLSTSAVVDNDYIPSFICFFMFLAERVAFPHQC
jgi:hypothetical protein